MIVIHLPRYLLTISSDLILTLVKILLSAGGGLGAEIGSAPVGALQVSGLFNGKFIQLLTKTLGFLGF